MQDDMLKRRMGVQRRNTGEAQHMYKKCWKVFDIISHGAVLWLWNMFQCGIPRPLSSFHLPSFLQPRCVTLYCGWCIQLETQKKCACLIQFKDNAQSPQGKHNKCKSFVVSTLTTFHGGKKNVLKWESLLHSKRMFISVVDRKRHLTIPPFSISG